MAYTQAGARAMATAHQMMLRASLENHPQHELHVQDTINYVNAVAEHYATMMKQYVDAKIDKLVSVEVNKQMNDKKV